jgi:hypothetical protein
MLGVGYRLMASAGGLTPATSGPFNVVGGVSITLANSAAVITWGTHIDLTVQFASNGAYRVVQVQATRDSFNWFTIGTGTTNAAGTFTVNYDPATNLYYRAVS